MEKWWEGKLAGKNLVAGKKAARRKPPHAHQSCERRSKRACAYQTTANH